MLNKLTTILVAAFGLANAVDLQSAANSAANSSADATFGFGSIHPAERNCWNGHAWEKKPWGESC